MRALRLGIAAMLMWIIAIVPVAASTDGAVYTMSNASGGNEILVFDRAADGSLSFAGSHATGGLGTGSGLGNQGGLVLSRNGGLLFAVNAGSDEISSFRVEGSAVQLRDVEPSGGDRPISVTIHDRILYVLNDMSGGNITGFRIGAGGALVPIPGSTQDVVGDEPAQIQFSPDGLHLVVTEKATNTIAVYPVVDGRAQPATQYASSGETPFGFAFSTNGHLIVSEAFGGAPNASAVSSYDFGAGTPTVISASVPTLQTAACWIVVTPNNRFAYTTNTGSASISGFSIDREGRLELLDDDGVTATTGAGPIDMAIAGRFLYSLDSGAQQISGFTVNSGGSLTPIGVVGGLPAGANGLAAG
jgi:6-phosphogluconolactonase